MLTRTREFIYFCASGITVDQWPDFQPQVALFIPMPMHTQQMEGYPVSIGNIQLINTLPKKLSIILSHWRTFHMHWCYFPSGILENSYLLFNFKEKTDGGPWNKLCGVLGCSLWGKHTSSKFYNSKQIFYDILKKRFLFLLFPFLFPFTFSFSLLFLLPILSNLTGLVKISNEV